MKKKIKNLIEDFKHISWSNIKDVLIGIKDVLIFSSIVWLLCWGIDFIASIIIGMIGG